MKVDPAGHRPFWQSPPVVAGALGAILALSVDPFLAGRSSGDFSLFLGRFHPLIVHLPIGMLVLLGFAELASLLPSLRERADKTTSLALPVIVVMAVASFILGHLLAGGGGFPSNLVTWHRRLTLVAIVAASASVVVWTAHERWPAGPWRMAYRGVLALTLGTLSVGAHFGGSITRGEGYLTKYAPEPVRRWLGEEPERPAGDEVPAPASPEPLVWNDVVVPVLRQRCVECHGAEQVKGGLRLDSLAAIQKGGDNGPVILSGAGDKSALVTRMRLPITDDERMPPEGKEGPSAEEIALIAWWIDRGASETLRVRDAVAPDGARTVLEKALSNAPAPSAAPAATAVPSADPSATPSADPSADPSDSGGVQGGGTDSPPAANARLVYAGRVAPILTAKCVKCHGDAKQKGKLRLDSLDAILAGGKEGPALVAGSPDKSSLVARARLPLSDPEHMPPPKEPQLTQNEIALIAFWIEKGAGTEVATSELPAELRGTTPAPTGTGSPTATSAPPSPSAFAPPTSASAAPTSGPTADPTAKPPRPLPPSFDPFADVVHPILVARCAGCHGEEQDSADLRVDTAELLMKGGESGPAVVAGKPDESLLLQRVRLPLDDTDHMPPESEPQPTAAEVEAIRWWIAGGAETSGAVASASLAPDVAAMLGQAWPEPAPQPSASASSSASSGPATSATAASSAGAGAPHDATGEQQGPPAVVGSGCAGCAFTDKTVGVVPACFATLGAILLWLRRWRNDKRRRR